MEGVTEDVSVFAVLDEDAEEPVLPEVLLVAQSLADDVEGDDDVVVEDDEGFFVSSQAKGE